MNELQIDRLTQEVLDRWEAMYWLIDNIGVDGWPGYVEGYRSGVMVGNWRFVDTLPDREIVFANMMDPAITKADLSKFVELARRYG